MKRVHRSLTREEVEALRRSIEQRARAGEHDIGGMIRDMRLVLRMSQAEYAQVCGVALRVLVPIEAGDAKNPGIRTVEKLLSPFGFRLGVIVAPQDVTEQGTMTASDNPTALAMVGVVGGPGAAIGDGLLTTAVAILVPEENARVFDDLIISIVERLRVAVPDGDLVLFSAAVRSNDLPWRQHAIELRDELFKTIADLGVRVVYNAVRAQLPDTPTAGEIESAAGRVQARVLVGLMQQLQVFADAYGTKITLAINLPQGVRQTVEGDRVPRPLALSALREAKIQPKGARPPWLGDLRMYDWEASYMLAANAVADALNERLLRAPADQRELALNDWALEKAVEPTGSLRNLD